MFSHETALDLECDAPAYPVVRACSRLGFRTPLDVAWHHLGRYLRARPRLSGILGILAWARVFAGNSLAPARCRCGKGLPALETCVFTYSTGQEAHYRIGQCRRCRTIFWEES